MACLVLFRQAEAVLDAGIEIDAVVELQLADEKIVKRMSGRRVHFACGGTYHIVYNPPKVEGVDNVASHWSSVPIMQEQAVRSRLSVYHRPKPVVQLTRI